MTGPSHSQVKKECICNVIDEEIYDQMWLVWNMVSRKMCGG